jgi:hypothetical protein
MFAITSTRIVGLIAVVCAVAVAPQALAASSTHTRIPPDDAVQGYDLSGFDLSALNAIPGHQQQQEYLAAVAAGTDLSGFDLSDLKNGRAAFTPATHAVQGNGLSGFNLTVFNNLPGYKQQQEYLAAVAAAASYKSFKAVTKAAAIRAAKAAAIAALQRRSAALDAAYRKLYPGLYRQTVQKSDNAAAWSFPMICNGQPEADYDIVCS